MPQLPKLQLSITRFSQLREQGCVYVDKTDLIAQLAEMPSKMVFLARPRRFGKTLLVSTFENLFAKGLKNFAGLHIEKTWDDKTYPVVRLDFSLVSDYTDEKTFRRRFQKHLISRFSEIGFQCEVDNPDFFDCFGNWLCSRPDSSIVLLIDEYDSALANNLNNKKMFECVRSCLASFFSIIKAAQGSLRFFFMTGITKFQNTRFFSSFNNLQDISMDPEYGSLLGYTERELCTYFGPYLDIACEKLGILERSELVDKLRDMYDGFCFDDSARTHVFVPWSVQSFLLNPQRGFKNYWYETGAQPILLMNFLKSHRLDKPQKYGEPIWLDMESFSMSQDYEVISPETILSQVGYLSIKEVSDGNVLLGYPNKEVALSMARLYARECLGRNGVDSESVELKENFKSGNVAAIVEIFNRTFASLDYKDYPIRSESECRALIQVLLIGASLNPGVEIHNAWGRSDLEVELDSARWIFEFKFVQTDESAQRALKAALQQMRDRKYGAQNPTAEKIRLALVYSAQSRSIVCWDRL